MFPSSGKMKVAPTLLGTLERAGSITGPWTLDYGLVFMNELPPRCGDHLLLREFGLYEMIL
jgi:hypothetical protein